MKKILFLLLLLPLLGRGLGGGLFAQNTIEVSGLTVEAGTVTFNVSWKKPASTATLWMDSAWVFVDYNKNGKMTRLELLPLSSGATLTATSAPGVGKLEEVSGNDKGMWVAGNARINAAGSFSATVQLLTATAEIAGACAYASGYPPVGRHVSSSEIVFTGTPMYELKLLHTDGFTVETIEAGGTFLLPCDYSMSSFTDATGAPGIKCIVPTGLSLTANYETICTGQSATLTASATNVDYYSINGSNWQTSPVFKVSPTSNASYTLYAKTSNECSATLTNAVTVAVNPIPSVPSLPTHNGPKCAGTGITFSATLPGGATGLDWTGSVNGQGTSKTTTATTAGNYSAQVRSYLTSGTTCYSEWTSAVSGAIASVPSAPSAAPTQDGPKCAGTAITFSATKPADATGLDWTGSVSGTGTSKTTATTAGNYSAQVRSYLTSAGTTCYSGWTGTTTGTVNSLAGRDQVDNGCCIAGLTHCNGYCRDLPADGNAVCYNGMEIKQICVTDDFGTGCTGGAFGFTAYSRQITAIVLSLMKTYYGTDHIVWSSEIGNGPCRYACTTNQGCTTCVTGTQYKYGWFGVR